MLLGKMVDAVIVSGIIGVAGALFGVLVNAYISERSESKRRKSEEQRWQIDHYLDRKIDSISSLYLSLLDWYFSVNRYTGFLPSCIGEYKEKVGSKEEAYWYCLIHASIYLEKSEYESMTNVSSVFGMASFAIYRKTNESISGNVRPSRNEEDPNAQQVQTAFENAVNVLQKYLSPILLNQESYIGYALPEKPPEQDLP